MNLHFCGRHAALFALSGLALLTACGGGGGDAGTPIVAATPRVAIGSSNADKVAAQAIDAADAGTAASVAANGGVQVSAEPVPGETIATLASLIRRVRDLRPQGAVGGVAVNTTTACSGGGNVVVAGNVANPNAANAGDAVTVTFNACVQGPSTINGAAGLVVVQINSAGTLWTVDWTMNNLSVTRAGIGSRLNGSMRFAFDDTSSTSSITDVTSASFGTQRLNGSTVRSTRTLSNFAYHEVVTLPSGDSSSTIAYTAAGDFPVLGSVSWQTTTPQPVLRAYRAQRPNAGQLRVVGGNGSTLTITLSTTGAQLAIDADGNGSTDATLSLTWAQLDALL